MAPRFHPPLGSNLVIEQGSLLMARAWISASASSGLQSWMNCQAKLCWNCPCLRPIQAVCGANNRLPSSCTSPLSRWGIERHVRQYAHPHLQLDIGLDDVGVLGGQQDLRHYARLGKGIIHPCPTGEAGLIGDDGPVGQSGQGQLPLGGEGCCSGTTILWCQR